MSAPVEIGPDVAAMPLAGVATGLERKEDQHA